VTDAVGRLIDFDLSAGQAGDIRFAIPLLSRLPAPDHQLVAAAYDGDAFRAFLIGRKTVPVIRPNPTRKQVPAFDEARYKQRNVVERCFSHLKDWRRVAPATTSSHGTSPLPSLSPLSSYGGRN
jgi:transposase